MSLSENTFVLTGDGIYRVIADYTEVNTPLDYELEHVDNSDNTMTVGESQVRMNLNAGNWKVIRL